MGDEVGLEFGGEAALVTKVGTVVAMGYHVLLQCVLGGKGSLTDVTLERTQTCTKTKRQTSNERSAYTDFTLERTQTYAKTKRQTSNGKVLNTSERGLYMFCKH